MIDRYIELLAKASKTQWHELIVECLEYYGANGTRELTEQQVKDFCKMKGVKDVSEQQHTEKTNETGI